eukprot:285490-Amphidinium_carterae.1
MVGTVDSVVSTTLEVVPSASSAKQYPLQEPQYLGVQKAPVANVEHAHDRFHVTGNGQQWAAALARQDVEELWEIWSRNNAATRALEVRPQVRPQGRGSLRLEQKTLRPPQEDRETRQEAFRQHHEASLLRMARIGQAVLAHAWPSWLGECPPTALAQRELLEGRTSARKTQRATKSRKAWQTYVREVWSEAPRKIYKWLRGKTLVWNLAVSLDGKWAAGPAEVAELE